METRRCTTKPMGLAGVDASTWLPLASKPWAIGFAAATQAWTHAMGNGDAVRSKGLTGERTG